MRISANPERIGLRGTSTIRVELLHPTGVPVRTGTVVRFSTDVGQVDATAETDGTGTALAILRGDGRAGSAKVTASSGEMSVSMTTTVRIQEIMLEAKFNPTVDGLTVFFDDQSEGEPDEWFWDFGDGSTSAEREPSHTYDGPGEYAVTLTVSNPEESDSLTRIVDVNEQPVAKFSFSVDGLEVSFRDESTGSPTSFTWDFGDGTPTSNLRNPRHTYGQEGTFLVELTVSNTAGESKASQFVDALQKPTADFTPAVDGLRVDFTDKSTGNPTDWSWDFGDGATSSARDPSHVYSEAATFRVTLTVSNAGGESEKEEFVTTVARPEAEFSFDINGLTVSFFDESTNAPMTWVWDFGDGSPVDMTQNPSHTYAAGTYDVTLTASNSEGGDTVTRSVTVP